MLAGKHWAHTNIFLNVSPRGYCLCNAALLEVAWFTRKMIVKLLCVFTYYM